MDKLDGMVEEGASVVQGVVNTLNTIMSKFEDTCSAEPYGYYLHVHVASTLIQWWYRGRPKLHVHVTHGILN